MNTSQSMKAIGVGGWIKSVPQAVREMSAHRVRRIPDHVNQTLRMRDGRTYVPFRQTVRIGVLNEPVVLQPRFHLRFMPSEKAWRYRLFRRVCIVTTPFFVGLPGFRSKLWMEDVATGDFAGLYQWDGVAEAKAYAEGLSKILRFLSVPGSVSHEITDHMTVAEYLESTGRNDQFAHSDE